MKKFMERKDQDNGGKDKKRQEYKEKVKRARFNLERQILQHAS